LFEILLLNNGECRFHQLQEKSSRKKKEILNKRNKEQER